MKQRMNFFRCKACIVLLILSITSSSAIPLTKGNRRVKYNFNSQWVLKVGDMEGADKADFDDASWTKITLPRAFNEDDAFKVPIEDHTTNIVWYRKHFKLSPNDKGKKVFLEFEGIRFGGDFYLNGKPIAIHENGVMAFGIDISDDVVFGNKENVLAVRIDNSWKYAERATGTTYQWNNINFNANYGGIPKNVFLHITDKVYQTLPLYSNLKTTGTYIYAREINITKKNALIFAESEVKNEHSAAKTISFEMQIEDMGGHVIKKIKSSPIDVKAGETKTLAVNSLVDDLQFWSWGYGYLYDVYTILYVDNIPVDVVKTRTGFRKTAFRNGMVELNDRILQMKGYAQRTSNEWPSVGMSVPAWLSDFSNRMIIEGNGNLVRWMHVTPWKQDVESCDRVGLIQAMPAGDAEKDVTGRQWEQRVELMRDAIIYNRNNPSILFYESGNESISEDHMAEMKAVRDLYDPYGGRAIGSREMLDSKIAEYGGEMLYINKSARIPMWATEYSRDEALRKYWDEFSPPYHKEGDGPLHKGKDASDYNRNQDSFAKEAVIRWFDYFRVRPGTGKRVSSGGTNIIFSDSNTHYRGAENYRRSGEVDAMRIPKDAFYAHRVMWDGWVDVENHRTHIVGHWNYTPQTIKDVLVVSSGDQVELFINGQSKGMGERSSQFLFTFKDIKWQEGKIEAISYSNNKTELSRSEIKTAGEPFALKMKVMNAPDGFKADGADLALIEVETVDKDGNRCPTSEALASFTLSGPAEWRGGIAQGKDNYILSKELPLESGVNRVLIRSTNNAGKVTLTALAKGLKPTTVSFESVPFKQKDGLAEYVSGEHQPSYTERGQTPVGASFTPSRQSIDIVAVTAGSNEDKANLSYDDNELSEWTNDGNIRTGWIKYELERDATISEIELKLTGWRMRSYPIIITVDDVEVYKGDTEKSLGYISIPIKPTKGRFVKIQLMGQSTDEDAFGGIVEVTGTKELDLYKDPNALDAKGQLRIVEAEVYETL